MGGQGRAGRAPAPSSGHAHCLLRPPGAGAVQDAAGQRGSCVPLGPRGPVSALQGTAVLLALGLGLHGAVQPGGDMGRGRSRRKPPQALSWGQKPRPNAGLRSARRGQQCGAGPGWAGLEQQGHSVPRRAGPPWGCDTAGCRRGVGWQAQVALGGPHQAEAQVSGTWSRRTACRVWRGPPRCFHG